MATHEDISELTASRLLMNQHISLQTLIDWVPDYMWVKDTESRFVVANRAIAADHGRQEASEMVGLSDFDLHAPELARQFRTSEQDLLHSGQPMIDREEFIVDVSGSGKWLSSTKVPVRNARNEIFGLVGIARNITARKQADDLRNGQAQILEMIATSAPLEDVLERLMRLIESQLTGYPAPCCCSTRMAAICGMARRLAWQRITPTPSTASASAPRLAPAAPPPTGASPS
ncbi:PAS domain-containing protein [Mesorhizobium cantuariense]|uniref:PAS domain-containing protein n=1 Tax=Mesorhizobium cantuariense TaxID=1300275 RepID=A0ABV7MPH5_9HYPH